MGNSKDFGTTNVLWITRFSCECIVFRNTAIQLSRKRPLRQTYLLLSLALGRFRYCLVIANMNCMDLNFYHCWNAWVGNNTISRCVLWIIGLSRWCIACQYAINYRDNILFDNTISCDRSPSPFYSCRYDLVGDHAWSSRKCITLECYDIIAIMDYMNLKYYHWTDTVLLS